MIKTDTLPNYKRHTFEFNHARVRPWIDSAEQPAGAGIFQLTTLQLVLMVPLLPVSTPMAPMLTMASAKSV